MKPRPLVAARTSPSPPPPPPTPPAGSRSPPPAASNIDQVSPVRTADGVLHVAWKKDGDIFHTAIGPDGKLRATSPIVSRLGEHERPGADRRAGRPARVLGRHPHGRDHRAQPGPQHRVLTDGGATWALQPGTIVPIGAQAYASDTSATTLPNGTTLESLVRDGRHVGACGHRSGDAELQLPGAAGATATIQASPPTRAARDAGLVLGLDRSRRASSPRPSTATAPRRLAADDARHAGDGRRPEALAHADRRAAEERRLLHRPRRRLPDRDKVRVWRVGSARPTLLDTPATAPTTASPPTPRAACGSSGPTTSSVTST